MRNSVGDELEHPHTRHVRSHPMDKYYSTGRTDENDNDNNDDDVQSNHLDRSSSRVCSCVLLNPQIACVCFMRVRVVK